MADHTQVARPLPETTDSLFMRKKRLYWLASGKMSQCGLKCLIAEIHLCAKIVKFVTTSLVVSLTCLVYTSCLLAGLLARPLSPR